MRDQRCPRPRPRGLAGSRPVRDRAALRPSTRSLALKVAYLNPTAALGGAERSLLDLLASLEDALPGFDPLLLTGEEGPLVEAARAQGVAVEVLPFPDALGRLGDAGIASPGALLRFARLAPAAALGARAYAAALRARLAAFGPDWIHSNALKGHLLSARCADLAPVAWHLRDAIGQRSVARRLLASQARRAAVGIGISSYVVRDARAVLQGLPLVRVENAIDLARFHPDAEPADLDRLARVPPLGEGAARIGLVATYGRWKGHDVFLEALGILARKAPRLAWRAYLVGGPIYRTQDSQWSQDELIERAIAAGVSDRVAFVPFQREPAPVFRALDVVVHASSRPEPFGRTIAEAMACGRATVVSDAGGAAELFSEGRTALGSPPGDAPALASALGRLLADPPLRARLGAAAAPAARSRFDRARLGREVAAIYRAYGPPSAR